jgi:hypothetical protein
MCQDLVLTYMGQPVAPPKDCAIMLHMTDKRRMIVQKDFGILPGVTHANLRHLPTLSRQAEAARRAGRDDSNLPLSPV